MLTAEAKYKKTGLDWMPEVPEHWEIRRVKTFCDFISRGNTPNYVEQSEFKVVNQATFSKGFWDESNIRYSDFGDKNLKGLIQKNALPSELFFKSLVFFYESTDFTAFDHQPIGIKVLFKN